MKLDNTILLFSVSTRLAFYINETFYGHHFAWCSPVFNTEKLDSFHTFKNIPPSSNPYTIYDRYKRDVSASDFHSSCIIQNKAGLKNGAIQKLAVGIIDGADFSRINAIIDTALISQYSPLLYLIPTEIVKNRIQLVDVNKTANPLSVEYLIHDLKKSEFEIIDY